MKSAHAGGSEGMLKSELSVMRFEVVLFKSFYGNRKMEHPLGVVILVELTSEERGVQELLAVPFLAC